MNRVRFLKFVMICQKIQLRGAGKEADITILPAVNNFPGMLLPNKVYNTSIEVMNNGDAEAERVR